MFIDTFSVDNQVSSLVPNAQDLLERVVYLVNEYSQQYINKRRGPVVRINLQRYDKKLMPLIDTLLDKRLPPKVRPFIVAKISRDRTMNNAELTIKLNEKHANLIIATDKEQ